MGTTSRKALLQEKDSFLASADRTAMWVSNHRGLVIAGAVILIGAAAGLWGGASYVESRDSDASAELSAALGKANAAVSDDEKDADPNADPPTFASAKARDEAAVAALRQVIANSPDTGVATVARFYLATTLGALGEHEAALVQYTTLVDALGSDDAFYFLAVLGQAAEREMAGDQDGALAALDKLNPGSKAFFADHAALQKARLLGAKGEVAQAIELLKKSQETHADSSVGSAITEQLQRFESMGQSQETGKKAADGVDTGGAVALPSASAKASTKDAPKTNAAE